MDLYSDLVPEMSIKKKGRKQEIVFSFTETEMNDKKGVCNRCCVEIHQRLFPYGMKSRELAPLLTRSPKHLLRKNSPKNMWTCRTVTFIVARDTRSGPSAPFWTATHAASQRGRSNTLRAMRLLPHPWAHKHPWSARVITAPSEPRLVLWWCLGGRVPVALPCYVPSYLWSQYCFFYFFILNRCACLQPDFFILLLLSEGHAKKRKGFKKVI